MQFIKCKRKHAAGLTANHRHGDSTVTSLADLYSFNACLPWACLTPVCGYLSVVYCGSLYAHIPLRFSRHTHVFPCQQQRCDTNFIVPKFLWLVGSWFELGRGQLLAASDRLLYQLWESSAKAQVGFVFNSDGLLMSTPHRKINMFKPWALWKQFRPGFNLAGRKRWDYHMNSLSACTSVCACVCVVCISTCIQASGKCVCVCVFV